MDIITLDSYAFASQEDFRKIINEKTGYKYIIIKSFFRNIITHYNDALNEKIIKVIKNNNILPVYFRSHVSYEHKNAYDEFFPQKVKEYGAKQVCIIEMESDVIFDLEKISNHIIKTYNL